MEEKIKKFQTLLESARKAVFFGGAGVSTESGIPDFRSQDGLYRQKWKYPPETIISRSFFESNTKEFYRFYREKLIIKNAVPNITHIKLAQLEAAGILSAVVTQNIDGLHQKAGSKNVFELHGSTLRNFCMSCGHFFDEKFILESASSADTLPHCSECGGLVKPDVVLYEEGLDDRTVQGSIDAIKNSDLLIIGGTSLVVYPAASLIQYYQGDNIVLINKTETPADSRATLVFHESLGKVFERIMILQ